MVFQVTSPPEIDLRLVIHGSAGVRQKAYGGIGLLPDVDIVALQHDVVEVDDALEIRVKVVNGVEENGARGISLELELGSFSGEEELGVAKVLDARGVGRNIPNPFLYLVETVGLQEVV
jgi:fructose/tagatose bisphosphate aldolase